MASADPRRIDTHFHSVPTVYRKALVAANARVRIPDWSPDLSLKFMDHAGIAAAVASLSIPGVHLGDDAKARDLARACNEEHAEMMTRYPRLGAVATLPLPDIDGACTEAIYALDVLKLDGVGLLTNYGGKYLGDPSFEPVLDILNARSATVPLHPAVHPSSALVPLRAHPSWLEYPFDTTRTAVSLVLADAVERFPNINFIMPHAGGTLPFLSWRLSELINWQVAQPMEQALRDRFSSPLTERYGETLSARRITELFGRFWYDTALAPGRASFGALTAIADPSKIVFGSDWPYAYDVIIDQGVAELTQDGLLTSDQQVAIDHGNALRLFPRFKGVH